MSSSATSLSDTIPPECVMYDFLGGKLDETATSGAYIVLVFLIILSILTCPLTIALNVLVIIAVKTKPRLRTNSNIVLGCLAVTDGLMGVIVQPLFALNRISTLQGDISKEYCILDQLTSNTVRLLCASSNFHLVLMSVERFLAIKYSFAYTTMVTKAKILATSAVAWITAVVLTFPLVITSKNVYLLTNNIILAVCLAIITFCQAAVYAETRRHERQIAAQQVTMEDRRKYLQEKKALKITTCVVLILLLSYLPIFAVRILLVKSTISSVNIAYIGFYTATFVAILNSLMNPVIYCVRMRQFRIAFIEILLRKKLHTS